MDSNIMQGKDIFHRITIVYLVMVFSILMVVARVGDMKNMSLLSAAQYQSRSDGVMDQHAVNEFNRHREFNRMRFNII